MATEAPAGSEAPAATTGESMAPAGSVAAVSGPFVQVAESDEYGQVLVDSECRTLYAFTQDADGEPTCVDDCAVNWPPLFTPDESVPPLADELDPSQFSVVEHAEGPMLKFGDWPLYYFAADAAPGDTNGQGVGGFWWMVAADGTLLEEAPEGTAPRLGPGRIDADGHGVDDHSRLIPIQRRMSCRGSPAAARASRGLLS